MTPVLSSDGGPESAAAHCLLVRAGIDHHVYSVLHRNWGNGPWPRFRDDRGNKFGLEEIRDYVRSRYRFVEPPPDQDEILTPL